MGQSSLLLPFVQRSSKSEDLDNGVVPVDGRFFGSTRRAAIGHVSRGDDGRQAIGLIEDGDSIKIDLLSGV